MPVTPTYPGVYVEELSSGVRTIVGVATSITAFVGRTLSGPVNDPISVYGMTDFERIFGGVQFDYPMTYAVEDFFLNGGGQALIVRLFKSDTDGTASLELDDSTGVSPPTKLKLVAASPGKWANDIRVKILPGGTALTSDDIKALGVDDKNKLFDIKIYNGDPALRDTPFEWIRNVSVEKASVRRIDQVLAIESKWLRTATSGDDFKAHMPPTDKDALKVAAGGDPKPLDETAFKGDVLKADGTVLKAGADAKAGIYALNKADLFNILCIPPDTRHGNIPQSILTAALALCRDRRAMLVVDPPAAVSAPGTLMGDVITAISGLSLTGPDARNAAVYYPRLLRPDSLRPGQVDTFVPCGAIAGIYARTDVTRGVWKAPAGTEASISGSIGLSNPISDGENGALNPLGMNCLRSFPVFGNVVWGARTMRGADQVSDDYKYVPVRRLALFIEESLYRGTKWVVFEPNDEPLWAQIRLNVGSFMHDLFRQGAFQGRSPKDAYFVQCDSQTTTPSDINLGIVNIKVGFAPLKPAEFVIIKIQQIQALLET